LAFPRDNQLLAMLPHDDLEGLNKHLATVELEQGQVLARPGNEIRRIYFPHSGIVSFMVMLPDGSEVQTGMVGRDGVIGVLDGTISINRIVVQIAGTAFRDRNVKSCAA
jgi:CRP-like cAMP-binding protein